jgi:uncharacterized membrane protein SirB2
MPQTYLTLFIGHALLALLSPLLLSVRLWRSSRGFTAARRWLAGGAYLTDTLLLLGGLALGRIMEQYPWSDAWLTAKALAFVAYLLAGHFALRHARSRPARWLAWGAALALYVYVVAVSLSLSRAPALGL